MEEQIKTEKMLQDFLVEGDIAVFGAGHAARYVIKYAVEKGIDIQKIYVSEACGNPVDIAGIPVETIDSIDEQRLVGFSILICLTEVNQKDVIPLLENRSFKRIGAITDELLSILQYSDSDYGILNFETLHWIKNQIESDIDRQTYQFMRFIQKPCLEYMIVNILDHCNLRCKGCDHFACIADEKFYPYESISQDIRRMAEIFNGDYIMKIAVMGGEPLLHPDLLKILKEVRNFFPHCTIRLSTNGLLLLRQGQDFWRVCRENRVTIVNTKYPINLDHEGMKKKAKEEGVEFQYFEGSGDGIVKHSFKKIINLQGDSDPADSFSKCHISNYGNFLLEGRFYGCPFSAQSFRIFNEKFNQNLRMTEDDYLDIYKVNDKEEFFKFTAHPRYYCRYCRGLSPLFPWSRSEGKITEWIEE